VCNKLQPILKTYQTAAPMAPFLYDDIGQLLRTLMGLFVKKSVLKEADTTAKLLKLDVSSSDVRCNYKEVDVGVASTKVV